MRGGVRSASAASGPRPRQRRCFFSALTIASPTPAALVGFWPVSEEAVHDDLLAHRQHRLGVLAAGVLELLLQVERTASARPAAFSSVQLKPVTVRPASNCEVFYNKGIISYCKE